VNYTGEACGNGVTSINCPAAASAANFNWIFADDVHPTGMSHRLLSLAVEQALLSWQ
jgi:phospholipase/lecithinase/hemolysin